MLKDKLIKSCVLKSSSLFSLKIQLVYLQEQVLVSLKKVPGGSMS